MSLVTRCDYCGKDINTQMEVHVVIESTATAGVGLYGSTRTVKPLDFHKACHEKWKAEALDILDQKRNEGSVPQD